MSNYTERARKWLEEHGEWYRPPEVAVDAFARSLDEEELRLKIATGNMKDVVEEVENVWPPQQEKVEWCRIGDINATQPVQKQDLKVLNRNLITIGRLLERLVNKLEA